MNKEEFLVAGHQLSITANIGTQRFDYEITVNGEVKKFSTEKNMTSITHLEIEYYNQTGKHLFD